MKPLPSVALTQRFLALCQEHGSKQLALSMVAAGRSTGVSGLPQTDDWTAWDADDMRAVVELPRAAAAALSPARRVRATTSP